MTKEKIHRTGYPVTEGRKNKAKKIEKLLEEYLKHKTTGKQILDIGCGNGEIARHFSERGNVVTSVDVERHFDADCGFTFILVENEKLPCPDNSMDIVISNHVIEHVKNQALHLREIHRVLKPRGVCYFASPNRVFPWEPHTRTLFLHYFPRRSFYSILKLTGRFREELYLLTYGEMKKLFKENGFNWIDQTAKVIKNPKQYYLKGFSLPYMPECISKISPTNIFIMQK
jgi:ubiquinone/menaquinone biosynthesis C-methylase UbiE